jgi:V-type H+-transporting ATPase subunit E
MDEARVELKNVEKDQATYQKLVKDLLLQGFFQVMEPEMTVQCRPQDAAYVQSIIPQVVSEYEAAVKQTTKASLDTSGTLPQESAGGVVVSALGDRIRVSNTLEARLEELGQIALPDVRTLLFGVSQTRAFYN